MTEYFIVARTFAAPFFSETIEKFVKAESPGSALENFIRNNPFPTGIYSANAYVSADAYHKNEDYLAQWLCNHEIKKQQLTKDIGSYSYLGNGPGNFEINGIKHTVKNPKQGRVQ